jgi:hypothetical protein
LPTAFAIAYGCPVENLIKSIGHDGSEIVWPRYFEPMRRRGFHIQEIIHVLYQLGTTVTAIEAYSRLAPTESVQPRLIDNTEIFERIVRTTRGVLTGNTARCGHAVAFDGGIICDPRGYVYRFDDNSDFTANCAWVLNKKQQDDRHENEPCETNA